jgi:hypothetical protein
MTKPETDVVLMRLVAEYEATRLKAVAARRDILILVASQTLDREIVADAHEYWLELEDHCSDIVQRIVELAEAGAADFQAPPEHTRYTQPEVLERNCLN